MSKIANTANTSTTTTGEVTPITTATYPPNTGMKSVITGITPMLLIIVAFYVILLRPQQKREEKKRKLINAVKQGDKIITNSGFIGVVHKVINDKEISLELAEGVRVHILKAYIADILGKTSQQEEVSNKNNNKIEVKKNDKSNTALQKKNKHSSKDKGHTVKK
ncbi:MAG: preprotein translocase subunit YajC [Alphaproteobacteria bacterium]|nr:preprotein translocase subunit YajC [Alphaproteobacteria bacterium]